MKTLSLSYSLDIALYDGGFKNLNSLDLKSYS